jgi:hypothetical protein
MTSASILLTREQGISSPSILSLKFEQSHYAWAVAHALASHHLSLFGANFWC